MASVERVLESFLSPCARKFPRRSGEDERGLCFEIERRGSAAEGWERRK
jgi:hypothetical protein